MMDGLLAPDALRGRRLAISTSDSVDLDRLGLREAHFRIAVLEMARAVLHGGGTLAYGGHLKEDGYTPILIDEARRHGRPDERPLRLFLAWSVHRGHSLEEITKAVDTLGGYGEIVFLDVDGQPVKAPDGRQGEEAMPVSDRAEIARGLTSMREVMTTESDGRLLLGGRRAGSEGRWPGLLEEAVLAVRNGQPLYPAAGFGGMTADIARVLAPKAMDWLPKPDGMSAEWSDGVAALQDAVAKHGCENGLTPDEMACLAATHRPSEIASLVSLGLGRRFKAP
ncbi:MAG: hypothetical protein LDL44_02425 [Caenispirillum sp.]|nr:hypothetical protein [Caenispirillum sp.]